MVNKSLHNLVIKNNNYEIVDASVRGSMANEYSSSSTYSIGDLVLHNGQLYECSTAINTAEAWTVAHWTAVTVGGKISNLKTSLGGKLDEPSVAGTSGQVLTSDGQGGQSWQTPQSGGGGSSPSPYTSNPAALGTASPGSSDNYARGDHVHAMPTAANVGAEPATVVTNVSGTTPSITANENTRYICGEVTTLSFTPCVSGICDVRFTSGSTATVLTVPNTVKFPDWFDPTSLEANTVYEINILDGVYGVVASWAV